MPFLALQPHVGYGLVGDRPIFLDLRRDRYLALDRQAERAFHASLHGQERVELDDPVAQRLLATGLFVLGEDPPRLRPAAPPAPARGLSATASNKDGHFLDMPRCWFLLRRAGRQIRSLPLEQVLAGRRSRTDPGPPTDGALILSLALRFRRIRSLVPIKPSCLQDSLALSDWLGRSAGAEIVFGVKLDPFAAHCWVQSGDSVLNDAPDKVAEFTPVFVLQ